MPQAMSSNSTFQFSNICWACQRSLHEAVHCGYIFVVLEPSQ